MSEPKKILSCSFCNKQQNQVKKLIAGPDVWICDDCVKLCTEILDEEAVVQVGNKQPDFPTCKQIMAFLDDYVIGQYQAKMVMSVAVNNHYKRINNQVIDEVEIDKSNGLLIGSSGAGKTLIAQTIARMLNVPFIVADATTLTSSGYVGQDCQTIIQHLLQAADGDVAKTERGIVFIDEIDKKAKRGENVSITRDVSGEDVQYELLKIIEGSEVRVTLGGNRKHPNAETVTVNTKNILFIVGGAFDGIVDIILERLNKNKNSIGFGSPVIHSQDAKTMENELLRQIEPEDFVKYGLIPQLMGRLPIIANLDELNEEQLVLCTV